MAKVSGGGGGGAGSDTTAVHTDTASEISAVTAKATPTTSDYLLIEDAADSNNKKSITLGDIPGGDSMDPFLSRNWGSVHATGNGLNTTGIGVLAVINGDTSSAALSDSTGLALRQTSTVGLNVFYYNRTPQALGFRPDWLYRYRTRVAIDSLTDVIYGYYHQDNAAAPDYTNTDPTTFALIGFQFDPDGRNGNWHYVHQSSGAAAVTATDSGVTADGSVRIFEWEWTTGTSCTLRILDGDDRSLVAEHTVTTNMPAATSPLFPYNGGRHKTSDCTIDQYYTAIRFGDDR